MRWGRFTLASLWRLWEQALVIIDNHLFQVQSTELADACNKLPPGLFGMPFCQLIRWFASPMNRAKPGLLSKLFSPSNTG